MIPSGAANVTEAELVRDVITVGRRRECEVVLSDKRASKKHFEIRRVGTQFLLKDLGSTTGTFVNDEQVTEAEIGHGDQIRVGSVEMVFEAISAEYSERQADFLSVESEVGGDLPAPLDFQGGGSEPAMEGAVPLQGAAAQFDLNHPQGEFQQQAHLGLSGDPSSGGQEIPGIESPKKKADRGLLARFRALTPRQQIIALPIILLGFWLLLEDDAPVEKKNPKKKPKVMASAKPSPGPKTYENLSDADKQLVNQRMSMAQTAFQNRAFDESIDAARMVTVILPDYTPATTMIALATAANEKKKQAEAEAARIKMEREQQLRIEALLAETAELMKQKKYAAAEEKFGEILSTDPENIKVSEWKRIIKEEQDLAAEKKREKEQEAQIRALMHERYLEAKALFDEKKYYEAIEASGRVEGKANSTDKKAAVALAVSARKAIDDLRDPLLKQARDSENNGELSKAFDLYQKATEADYLHKEGYDAMKRIRMVLHERGRKLYREGVLAEYFNDVPEALAKFNEILTVVPKDDDYHLRAVRKLARYGQEPSRKPSAEGAPTSEGAGAGSQGTGGP